MEPGSKLAPGLHVVATPLGNLGDVSRRAVEVLRGAAMVACEDSRVTGRLLFHLGVRARLQVYNDHNAAQVRPRLLACIANGGAVALVTDAGTPCISDPGYRLVREAREAGHTVIAVPGPSAVIAALSIAGLPTDRFLFMGFLPPRATARRQALAEVAQLRATLALYESGPRLGTCLADALAVLGPREAAVARELTKLHEEVVHGSLAELAERYRDQVPKGEIVVLIGPPEAAPVVLEAADLDQMLLDAAARLKPKEAAKLVAVTTGRPVAELYQRLLELKGARG